MQEENINVRLLRSFFKKDVNDEPDKSKIDILNSLYVAVCWSIAKGGTLEDLKAVTAEYDRIKKEDI